jgi:hypothetical protein
LSKVYEFRQDCAKRGHKQRSHKGGFIRTLYAKENRKNHENRETQDKTDHNLDQLLDFAVQESLGSVDAPIDSGIGFINLGLRLRRTICIA